MACYLLALVLAAPLPAAEPEKAIYAALTRDGVARLQGTDVVLTVSAVDGKKLVKPLLIKRSADGDVQVVAHAASGELRVNATKNRFTLHLVQGSAQTMDGSRFEFRERNWELPLSGK